MMRFYCCNILLLTLTLFSCASKKKVGLHFQNMAYNQYSRHEDLNMNAERDHYRDSIRQRVIQELDSLQQVTRASSLVEDSKTMPSTQESDNEIPDVESKLSFAYDNVSSTEETRASIYQNTLENKVGKKRSRLISSKSSRGLFGGLSIFSGLTALFVRSMGYTGWGIAFSIAGLILGSIGFLRAKSKGTNRTAKIVAQIGMLISGLTLFGILADIMFKTATGI